MSDEILRAARAEDPLHSLDAEQRALIEAWHETELRREREHTKAERRKRAYLEKELGRALQQYDDLCTIVHADYSKPILPKVQGKSGKGHAAVLLLWSDWHIDEVISPNVVNGLNEYSVEIAWQRVHALIERTRWQVEAWQKISTIDTIVIAALGDWVAGDIHEELQQTCLPPQEATRIVREMHEWALDQLLKIKGIERICYKGMSDNHGRTTRKNHWINGHQRSHNWGMYHALAAIYSSKGETRVEFEIAEGSLLYVEIADQVFRLAHGHQISYAGGVGGISIPGLKWVARSNAGRLADYTLIGHFHQARDFGKLLVNGSLVGPDAYSTAKGFEPEPPTQLALLVRPEFGVCDISKIFPQPREPQS